VPTRSFVEYERDYLSLKQRYPKLQISRGKKNSLACDGTFSLLSLLSDFSKVVANWVDIPEDGRFELTHNVPVVIDNDSKHVVSSNASDTPLSL
jgi:hypothetical protein